ncbi:MAG TPA: hypothetical protein PKK43_08720, partial [Spirochaetota bacterium]|nr:hypothetical protein [Spirochaetota bacterium]
MIYIAIYWLLLFTYSIVMWRRHRTTAEFLVNSRASGPFNVAMSLIALIFGASSVFGLAGYAYTYGLNAVWWTFSGILFLLLLRYLFVEDILRLKAFTISDTVSSVFGAEYKIIVSAITVIAWTMILAGQIIAGGTILDLIIGNRILSFALFCAIFFSYTFVTGQSGTVRTSWIQTLAMTAGLVFLLGFVYHTNTHIEVSRLNLSFGFNDKFTPGFFLSIFIPVGLSYLFGPDIYSRIFTARDASSAEKGILLAAGATVVLTLVIAATGIIGGSVLAEVKNPDAIIASLASMKFSGAVKYVLLVLLMSIPLSGADAMLANMSTMLGKDIMGGVFPKIRGEGERNTVILVRGSMIVIAAVACFAALNAKQIIPTLLISYKIFSCTVVPLLMISMVSLKRGIRWNNR